MQQVLEILKEAGYGYLATVEGGQPRVRPFGFMFEEGGRLYFCTSSEKRVYRQMLEESMIEYAATTPKMMMLRIAGRAVFTEERDKREKAFAAHMMMKRLYQSADDPRLKVFMLEHGHVEIADFSGFRRAFDF